MTTILLDVDIPIFKIASVSEEMEPAWDGSGEVLVVADLADAAKELDAYIVTLMDKLNADNIIMCLSEPAREKNWRRGVLPSYKAPRGEAYCPQLRAPLLKWVEENYDSWRRPTLEGDDVLGILATNTKVVKGDKILVSSDKDLRTIPSVPQVPQGVNYMYNPDKDSQPYINPLWLADWYWMYQTLIGDKTDNYTGLPKCGPARAVEILDIPKPTVNLEDMWYKVVKEYVKKGHTEEDALVQARVARICRTEDFNYKTKEVKLWSPDF